MSFTAVSVFCSVVIAHLNQKTKTFLTEKNILPRMIREIFIKRLVDFLSMQKVAKKLLEVIVKNDKEINKDQRVYVAPISAFKHNFDDFFCMVANDLISREDQEIKENVVKCLMAKSKRKKHYTSLENIESIKRSTSRKHNEYYLNKSDELPITPSTHEHVKKKKPAQISDLDYIKKEEHMTLYIYYEWVLVALGKFAYITASSYKIINSFMFCNNF